MVYGLLLGGNLVRRGEFWIGRLNMTEPRGRTDQWAETAGYVLVLSNDAVHKPGTFAIVAPRTSRGGSFPGGVSSPLGDGGCNRPGFVDCCQLYTLAIPWVEGKPTMEDQLCRRVSVERGADNATMSAVEKNVARYLGPGASGYLRDMRRRTRHRQLGRGTVVLAQWGDEHPGVECVVVSNTIMNERRPLNLVTVLPTVDTVVARYLRNPILLEQHVDGVSEDRIVILQSPYTIDIRCHIRSIAGVVSEQKMATITSALKGYLSLDSAHE